REAGHAGHGDLDLLRGREGAGADRGAVLEKLDPGRWGAAAAPGAEVGLGRGLGVVLRVGERAGQRGGANRVAGGRAHVAGRAEPLAAGAHQQQEQHEGGRRHHELDGHRAAVIREPAPEPAPGSSSQGSQPHAAPWLAWVRKHSIGPDTVSLMVSGQMPVILPWTVTETVPFWPGLACAVTPEIRLVSRPR